MSYIANQWGPAYRGVTGHFKKAVEIINLPWNLPFITGFFAAGALILSIPVSEKSVAESKFANREEVMEKKRQKTGSYH